MAARGGGRREWVVEVEKTLSETDPSVELSSLPSHCIYRVPASIKNSNPEAYRQQVVSLGPFHHGDPQLLPMEEHKRRALLHVLRRAKKPVKEFTSAIESVMEELQDAYMDLDAKWRDADGRKKFLEIMIVDGCFLLELMRAAGVARAGWREMDDYAPNDSIFSSHGVTYMVPYIRHDMLMLENQLPLLLLAKLIATETHHFYHIDDLLTRMVLKFLSPTFHQPPPGAGLGLHPLDVYRRSMLYGPYPSPQDIDTTRAKRLETDITRSAVELYEAGIRFKKSTTDSLHNIQFRNGVLNMPAVSIDVSTEYILRNMMAFERLHAGAGNDVTAYVFFMNNIIRSEKDAALLSSKGIIQSAVGSDRAVVRLFNGMCKDVAVEPEGPLDAVHQQMYAHCRKPWNKWRASIIHNYFQSPPSFINFVAASTALLMTIIQTIYSIVSFYKQQGQSNTTMAPTPT